MSSKKKSVKIKAPPPPLSARDQARDVADKSLAMSPRLPTTLVSFTGGAYKKISHIDWKHSINPRNVDYMEDL